MAIIVNDFILTNRIVELSEEYSKRDGSQCAFSTSHCLTPFHSFLLYFSLALAILHTMHVNIFVNARLNIRQKFPCIWTGVNMCICRFGMAHEETKGMQWLCRDRCCTLKTICKHLMIVMPLYTVLASILMY